jgi:hypothetical protein
MLFAGLTTVKQRPKTDILGLIDLGWQSKKICGFAARIMALKNWIFY